MTTIVAFNQFLKLILVFELFIISERLQSLEHDECCTPHFLIWNNIEEPWESQVGMANKTFAKWKQTKAILSLFLRLSNWETMG